MSVCHLDGLTVVDLDDVKAEAVNATSWCLEHTRLQVKMVANVDENLQEENIMSPGQKLKREAEIQEVEDSSSSSTHFWARPCFLCFLSICTLSANLKMLYLKLTSKKAWISDRLALWKILKITTYFDKTPISV